MQKQLIIVAVGYILIVIGSIVLHIVGPTIASLPLSANSVIAVANIFLVIITLMSLHQTRKSSARAEKVFIGQDKPQIDVTPLYLVQNQKRTHVTTFFSVTNYSGFTAYNIGIDLKYGGGWILDRRMAQGRKSKGKAEAIEWCNTRATLYVRAESENIEA